MGGVACWDVGGVGVVGVACWIGIGSSCWLVHNWFVVVLIPGVSWVWDGVVGMA